MAVFTPYSTVEYGNPVIEEMQFKTLLSNFDNLGEERRKRKWLYPKRLITLQYSNITKANGRTLFDFYIARSGAYDAFTFFKYERETYTGEYVGTGDASTTLMNLPCKTSSWETVYLDGSEQTGGGTHYTLGAGTGTDGADKITWESAPASGERVTVDFLGYLKIKCRFKDDNMSFETFMNTYRTVGIQLQGILNS